MATRTRWRRRPPRPIRAWAVLACLLLSACLAGQEQEAVIPAELISSDSGMEAELVFFMAQDRRGFMWFGTNLGVARHDGFRFHVFRRANTLPHPLSSDDVYSLIEDAAGDLWLGTGRGLNRFDAATETFTAFQHDPSHAESLTGSVIFYLSRYSVRPDSLWVATADNGLGLFDVKTAKCKSYRADPSRPGALRSNEIRMTFEDSQQQVWVATADGLHRFLPDADHFEVFRHDPHNDNTIGANSVFDVFESGNQPGILWVGTDRSYLNCFDFRDRKWERFRLPPAVLPDPFSNQVYLIRDYPAEPDALLVGTRQGLYRFHRRRHSWQRIVLRDQFQSRGDPHQEFILGICCDRSGACWVSIRGRGVLKFVAQAASFRLHVNPVGAQDPSRLNRIYDIAEDARGLLWLAMSSFGLHRYAPDKGRFEHFSLAPDAPARGSSEHYILVPSIPDRASFNYVTRLCCTRQGEIWAATRGGLVCFDPVSGTQEIFAVNISDPGTLGFNGVISICEDSGGGIWIGSESCLLRRDPRTRNFNRYWHDPQDPGSLSGNRVSTILEDREKNIWVGTSNGLNLYDRGRDRFTRYYLDPPDPGKETQNTIMVLHQDLQGRIWVGTPNGLNLMELRGDEVRFQHFNSPGSTLRNYILGILDDDEDKLWISSPGGLSRFHMPSRTFSLYDGRDGVPGVRFIHGSCLRAQSGELFFGGNVGMISFKPWQLRFNRYEPPLAFTDIQVWRKPLAIGGASPLRRSIVLAPDLDLPHDQNSLTLSFAALSYVRPEKNQYAYRLDGRDGSAHDLGFEHSVNLDNLKPGRYRLRVWGSNNEGVWNREGISLAIRIRPPFWQAWWFRALVALAVIAFFVQWNRTRARRLAARIKTEAAMDHYCDQYHISAREKEIIRLVLRGKSNREIEDALFISMGTVKNHIYSIFQKLGIKNRGQLITLFKNLQVK